MIKQLKISETKIKKFFNRLTGQQINRLTKLLLFIFIGTLLLTLGVYAATGTIRYISGTFTITAPDNLSVGGKLGIGTTPAHKLDVAGDVRWTGILQGGSVPWPRLTSFPSACPSGQFVTAVGGTLTCATPAGVSWPLLSAADGTASAPVYSWSADTDMGIRRGGTDNLRFVTAGSDRLTIDSVGNVGIGITAPGDKLQVDSGGATTVAIRTQISGRPSGSNVMNRLFAVGDATGVSRFGLTQNFTTLEGDGTLAIGTIYSHPLIFGTVNAERMRITTAGNVGIGTTAPGAELDIGRNITTADDRSVILFSGMGDADSGWDVAKIGLVQETINDAELRIEIGDDSSDTIYIGGNKDGLWQATPGGITITATGNVGIGTTTPAAKLEVVGGVVFNQNTALGYRSRGIITGSRASPTYIPKPSCPSGLTAKIRVYSPIFHTVGDVNADDVLGVWVVSHSATHWKAAVGDCDCCSQTGDWSLQADNTINIWPTSDCGWGGGRAVYETFCE